MVSRASLVCGSNWERQSTPNRKKTETFRCKSKKRTQTNPRKRKRCGGTHLGHTVAATAGSRRTGKSSSGAGSPALDRRSASRAPQGAAPPACALRGKGPIAEPLDGGALAHGRARTPARGPAAAPSFLWPPRADAAPCSPMCAADRKRGEESRRVAGRRPVAGPGRVPATAAPPDRTGRGLEWRLGFRSRAPTADGILSPRNARSAVHCDGRPRPRQQAGRAGGLGRERECGPRARALCHAGPGGC